MSRTNYLLAFILIALLDILRAGVLGQAEFSDSSSNVRLSVSATSNDTSTELKLQISGPRSNGWAAVGIGSQMRGALMFVMYPSSDQNTVTVSVRTTSGHVMPRPATDINYAVEQSSLTSDTMSADVVCYNCQSWSGGTLDTSSTQQPWIYAVGPQSDSGLASNENDASISQHSRKGTFTIDMTVAAQSSGGANTAPYSSSPSSGDSEAGSPGRGSSSSTSSNTDMLVLAHAGLLIGTFVGILPLGAILLRLPWRLGLISHGIFQLTGTAAAFSGMGIAIAFSIKKSEPYNNFTYAHQILGLTVVSLLAFQVGGGILHHVNFQKTGRRSIVSFTHMLLGRAIIIGAMVNAILGFRLKGNKTGQIAVGVVSLVILIVMEVATNVFRRRTRRPSGASDTHLKKNSSPRQVDQSQYRY